MSALLWYIGGVATGLIIWLVRAVVAPAFLDQLRLRRSAAIQREAEERANARADQPTRSRIVAALLELMRALRRGVLHGEFTLVEWQARHDTLKNLDGDAAARALGDQYQTYRDSLEYDQLSINIANEEHSRFAALGELEEGRRRYEVRQHDARATQNMAQVISRFVPLLANLGQPFEARRLEYVASTQDRLAVRVLSELPHWY